MKALFLLRRKVSESKSEDPKALLLFRRLLSPEERALVEEYFEKKFEEEREIEAQKAKQEEWHKKWIEEAVKPKPFTPNPFVGDQSPYPFRRIDPAPTNPNTDYPWTQPIWKEHTGTSTDIKFNGVEEGFTTNGVGYTNYSMFCDLAKDVKIDA